ncbi:MexW/MexI family multidrug efflux RND transporter permease subunit [Spongorhabdus nitratireducens]
MRFTDLFIKRPVLATVVSLMIILLGLQAFSKLQIREYPELETGVITVSTAYAGANASLIQGFITTPLQQVIASSEGIDYIRSSSSQNSSTISVYLQLGYDSNVALSEIMSKVASVRDTLPDDASEPVISKGNNQGSALLYISFYSDIMNEEQVTDYLSRVVQPKLATIEGVGSADILGEKKFAMRIWLDPVKMAGFNVTASDVNNALRNNNVQSAAGETRSLLLATAVDARTGLSSPEDFSEIVVSTSGDTLVRLADVARVELTSENFDSMVRFNGQPSVYMAISATPSANALDVIERVRTNLPDIQNQLPAGLESMIVYDATEFIQASINEVSQTLIEAALIVIVVVFLFLGSLRVVLIPVVTIPLSLVGVLFVMMLMGYTINLMTLLAMVLAIGLVVDDAIVVVENIHRHIEEGKTPFDAALEGAREIALPVITMTITLAAVYAPIGFLGGITGALFREFAFTLAGSVVISGIVALTLSPMMCSRILKPHGQSSRMADWLDQKFDALKQRYQRQLHNTLNYRPVILLLAFVVLTSIPFLYQLAKQELAPTEDQGIIFIVAKSPQATSIDYLNRYTSQFEPIFEGFPEYQMSFQINGNGGPHSSFSGMKLNPWADRERSQQVIQKDLQNQLQSQVSGLEIFSFNPPALPGAGGGLPIQFLINTTADYETLYHVADQLQAAAMQSGLFMFISNELRFNRPETVMHIDRDKAARLGINMSDISRTLSTLLGEGDIDRFSESGRSYKVIPQADADSRLDKNWLYRYQVRTASGDLVPLATIITLEQKVSPNTLPQFQQLNSAKLQGVMLPGVSIGEALTFLQNKANELLPEGFSTDYEGESRQYIEEGNALLITFFFALLVIFLVLSAQFESFRDPLIILITVPMSICGALIPLALGSLFEQVWGVGFTLNIYTQIGLVTLIGLISKHGILIVEFANQLRHEQGYGVRAAVEEASALRLRPILMTTAATVMGIFPLLFAAGAGAASRFNIGLVIVAGMTIGTLFTLYVVPVMYSLLAKENKPAATAAVHSS